MPKRADLKKIMIIGAGPIIIGQACEFDYSGSQACKALKEEGYEVVLVNSNPATIMTDPGIADATYIEPLTPEFLEFIIKKERPDAILPTLGGQTGLNLAMKLHEQGILAKYNVQMLGAKYEVIKKAEDRSEFKAAAIRVGLDVPRSVFAYNLAQSLQAVKDIGFPCIVRASFTLGGTGGGIAHNMEEFERIAALGIESSMIHEILIEESIEGWKEYELEVMRDHSDNVVIICSIENLDPMGVHTGDSITVAPAQTLTDKEYQQMRDASIRLIREIGVETGGSNIQFAVDPRDGRMVVIEVNPRVSRSSALASKATGFPIAKFAALLSVGYSLDEIQNDITRETPACFEPAIDYVVVKIPRFTFEKFPEAKDVLGVQMKSVGETMAIGRNFKEALQKGLRGLEIDHIGLDNKQDWRYIDDDKLRRRLAQPNASRIFYLKYALQKGMTVDQVSEISKIDIWFIDQIAQILEMEEHLKSVIASTKGLGPQLMRRAKEYGFSDAQLAEMMDKSEKDVRAMRLDMGIAATFKLVDTCAAEFEAYTPYYYSTYETEDEAILNNQKRKSKKKKIMILGGGPNRIGQGIEFDYCCCHAAFALREMGFETIMVNSNPETVSTDYDTSDRLYFEPLTFEDVMNVFEVEKPDGVIVQFGGQTPLNLARRLSQAGVPIIGTSVDSIDVAENREHFSKLMDRLKLCQPANASTTSKEETLDAAGRIGYPVLVRPSYVLGGRAMRIVYDEESIKSFLDELYSVSRGHPVLIDKFLEDAQEVDVDAICDGVNVFVAGVMEHIENAGIHSGDSACVLPPHTLSVDVIARIKDQTVQLARALGVVGLMNIQFAVKGRQVYVLEVNPRASRTVPFVSKAIGLPLAKIAAQIMAGKKLNDFALIDPGALKYICVKESVLPFSRFSGVDIILGPEMKSTGEVMGIAATFGAAFAKSQIEANQALPKAGMVFISVNDHDKKDVALIAGKLADLKFKLVATRGTAQVLRRVGIEVMAVDKHHEGEENALTLVKKGEINLIINTPSGKKSQSDMRVIRAAAILHNIPCITTLQGAWAAVNGIEAGIKEEFTVEPLQNLYNRSGVLAGSAVTGPSAKNGIASLRSQ
ncbi:MAG: carbamoyl-phosphate synthase large subunit [Candidatus Omnitrophica bacterium]|nr:carbamoyl-phosphate synthase large subunit [Candidatus Omnitrophota bacterium]MDE2010311.1 carbamoyl-phosphate synthase large subunit [Candidatus Omnitrophota bacterium]MDE2232030.1 carbamoyl-phosphate synthase large subunit [Candidatus Omnitrophota bacterium]